MGLQFMLVPKVVWTIEHVLSFVSLKTLEILSNLIGWNEQAVSKLFNQKLVFFTDRVIIVYYE